MVTIAPEGTPCACPDCDCRNDADVVTGAGVALCGCCVADCPDVHGPDGRTGRAGYQVRAVPWSGGFELHVDGFGVTQCVEIGEAEATVREYLSAVGREDAATAAVAIWRPPDEEHRAAMRKAIDDGRVEVIGPVHLDDEEG